MLWYMQVNTDGLVLRGWYTSLTLAVYGTAERSHGHDQGSPPPPPPPPPQQPSGPKRIIKQGEHHGAGTTQHSRLHTHVLKLKRPSSWFCLCFLDFMAVPLIGYTVCFLQNGKRMTSTMAAHQDRHPEGLALHPGLHPLMTMMKSRSK